MTEPGEFSPTSTEDALNVGHGDVPDIGTPVFESLGGLPEMPDLSDEAHPAPVVEQEIKQEEEKEEEAA